MNGGLSTVIIIEPHETSTERWSYQSSGGELEEAAGNDRTEKLGDPVEDASQQTDVTSDEGSEGDSGVDVAAGDVCANSDCNKQSEAVGDGGGDEAGGGGGTVIGELVEGHAGAWTGEDEDEGGYELGQRGLQGIRVRGLLGPADGYVSDRHIMGCVERTESSGRESTGFHFSLLSEGRVGRMFIIYIESDQAHKTGDSRFR